MIGTVTAQLAAAAHPDRNDGDQLEWDRIEAAAAALNLGGAR